MFSALVNTGYARLTILPSNVLVNTPSPTVNKVSHLYMWSGNFINGRILFQNSTIYSQFELCPRFERLSYTNTVVNSFIGVTNKLNVGIFDR